MHCQGQLAPICAMGQNVGESAWIPGPPTISAVALGHPRDSGLTGDRPLGVQMPRRKKHIPSLRLGTLINQTSGLARLERFSLKTNYQGLER